MIMAGLQRNRAGLWICLLLAAGTLGAVLMFGSSDALGGAYGIAVSMLMAITTVLAALVALQWGYHPVLVAGVNGLFLIVDVIFVAANATKLIEGGWFPMVLAGIVAFLMMTSPRLTDGCQRTAIATARRFFSGSRLRRIWRARPTSSGWPHWRNA